MDKKLMTKEELDNYYYNGNDLLSYNASISFVMGERAGGKTFFFKRKLIDDFLKYKRTAVYIRRELVQIENVCHTLFDDVIASDTKYQELEFTLTGSGNKLLYSINGEPFCWLLNLKSFNKYKGVYFDTFNMFFDEFIEESGFYLKDEHQAFMSLVSTIFRDRTEFRIFMASNSISYYCWLFEQFNIRPDGDKRFYKSSSGKDSKGNKIFDFVLELSQGTSQRAENMAKSRLGLLYTSANLGDYMLSNKALKDNKEHICKKKPKGYDYLLCVFFLSGKKYSVWTDHAEIDYYIDEKGNEDIPKMYKVYMNEEEKKEGWISIKSARDYPYIKRIRRAYYNGLISFNDQPTKNDFIKYIARYL